MLVLGRREGESIRIGDGIYVTVVRIQGNTVRIGITAPGEVIVRTELLPEEGVSDEPIPNRG
jgi:carbon storage regulator